MESNRTFCCVFHYCAKWRGNQHGGHKYNELQNWFHVISHANRVFSLNFWQGGTSKFFVPESGGGGDLQKSDWSRNCPPNAKHRPFFAILSMTIQLFKVLLSLKVLKFDTKMYLKFSNFRGRRGGGETSLGPKTWDKCRMGGPPRPPGKKPCMNTLYCNIPHLRQGIDKKLELKYHLLGSRLL